MSVHHTEAPCRIGFDVSALDPTFKAHAARGIGRYVSSLTEYFEREAEASSIDIHHFQHSDMVPNSWLNWAPFGKTTLKQQILYPLQMKRFAKQHSLQGYHFPAHMDPPAWSPVPYIVTVLDLIPIVCADMYRADRPGWRFHLARWLELRAIQGASLVIAISECTKRDVHRLLGVPENRIIVTPLGVDDRFFKTSELPETTRESLTQQYGIEEGRPLILYVGGIDERKNIPAMLKIFAHIVQRARDHGNPIPMLMLAGKIEQDRHYPGILTLLNELQLSKDVLLPGFVPDTELQQLFSVCSLFWFMSLYEGFGLPPLEACAAGVPVVSSNTSVMPEVLDDAALLVDPTDEQGMIEAVESVLQSKGLQQELSARGPVRARLYPWSNTGERTLEAYAVFSRLLRSGTVEVPSTYQRAYGGDQHPSS